MKSLALKVVAMMFLAATTSAQLNPILNATNLWTITHWEGGCSSSSSSMPSNTTNATTSQCTYAFLISGLAHPNAGIPSFSALCSNNNDDNLAPAAATAATEGFFKQCTLLTPKSAQGEMVSAKLTPLALTNSTGDGSGDTNTSTIATIESSTTDSTADDETLYVSYAFQDAGMPIWWNYTAVADPSSIGSNNFTFFPTEVFAIA